MTLQMQTIMYQDLRVRPYTPEDTPALIELLSEIFKEYGYTFDLAHSENDYQDLEKAYATGEYWVAQDPSGLIAGSCAYRALHGSGAHVAELRRLYVKSTHRKRGLGGMLLAAIEYRAHAAGFTSMLLESVSVLKEATALYKTVGYTFGTLPSGLKATYKCDLAMYKKLGQVKDVVQVVNEEGKPFAHLTRKIAMRGRMRVVTFALARVFENCLAIAQHPLGALVSIPSAQESPRKAACKLGGPNIIAVMKAVSLELEDQRMRCHVFVRRESESGPEGQNWTNITEAAQVLQNAALLAPIKRVLDA